MFNKKANKEYTETHFQIQIEWRRMMTNNNFFMPTKQEILDLEIGSLVPDYTGKLKPIVEIAAKQQDISGKWFICYYVPHGENGRVSGDLKEDELHITAPLSCQYKSHELNIIEARMLQERGIELPKRLEWCAPKSPAQRMSQG